MSTAQAEAPHEKDHAPGAHGTAGEHGHGNGHGEPFLQHHFDSHQQQFETGKLGVWLFLAQEVLFFTGLFCAYAVYRSMHPEIFKWAHYFLDKRMGALNTIVLIFSSFTAAWAVRAAQLGQRRTLIANICVTIACAFTFMGVKYFEYSHKFHDGLLWGRNFNPTEEVVELESFKHKHPEVARAIEEARAAAGGEHGTVKTIAGGEHAAVEPKDVAAGAKPEPAIDENAIARAAAGHDVVVARPRDAHIFFGIYFFMTGLHGLHVVAGIIIWFWMLVRAVKGHFGPKYFGPIDFSALYWHLVDLVWIYLFPLLYLIS